MNSTYLQRFLSDSARSSRRSEIRDLLRVVARPGMISLGGGLPSPETFPIEELAELLPEVLRREGARALQYGTTEGNRGLREEILKLHADDGLPDLSLENILPTSSSQQALDIVTRVFVAPGDTVVLGLPSYLGALGAFAAVGARMLGVPLDDGGMPPDLLEARLIDARRRGERPKLLYLIPDFQNPAGVTLERERRSEILQIATEFDLLVVEDSPYRHLRYEGESLPTLKSLDTDGRVISLFTFSKILFPGLRLGWVVAHPDVVARFVVAKQAMDLCSGGLVQIVAREYLRAYGIQGQIARSRATYTERRDRMLAALSREMKPDWGVTWTRPKGGLFLWVTLPRWMDASDLLRASIEQQVAFVGGRAFHCDGSGANTLRLNFSYPTPDQIDVAIERLGRAVESMMESRVVAAAEPAAVVNGMQLDPGRALEDLALSLSVAEIVE